MGQVAQGDTAPEFEAAMAAMEAGQICSEPVRTRYGVHVLRSGSENRRDRCCRSHRSANASLRILKKAPGAAPLRNMSHCWRATRISRVSICRQLHPLWCNRRRRCWGNPGWPDERHDRRGSCRRRRQPRHHATHPNRRRRRGNARWCVRRVQGPPSGRARRRGPLVGPWTRRTHQRAFPRRRRGSDALHDGGVGDVGATALAVVAFVRPPRISPASVSPIAPEGMKLPAFETLDTRVARQQCDILRNGAAPGAFLQDTQRCVRGPVRTAAPVRRFSDPTGARARRSGCAPARNRSALPPSPPSRLRTRRGVTLRDLPRRPPSADDDNRTVHARWFRTDPGADLSSASTASALAMACA